ncbi:MAG: IS4 family transposase [Bacteroidota bacterium]
MEVNPFTKIVELVRSFQVVWHLDRQRFLVDLVRSMIVCRSVVFSELADKMDRPAQPISIERKIQDFFLKVSFDYQHLLQVLLVFIPAGRKLTLSIDRTEWDRGQHQYNILCVIASIGKMGVPLYFELLDNNSGNSNHQNRIQLFTSLLKQVGKDRIELVVMDREFIGQKWLSWLKKAHIPFCVRVPKNHKITFSDGRALSAEELLAENDGYFIGSDLVVDGVVVEVSISRTKDGDLLYFIGTIPAKTLKKQYKKRWTIEVFFQAIKGRGFDIEKTGLRSDEKLRKLFAVVALAYTLCWALGVEHGKLKPVKPKNHGYPQYSIFRRGLNLIREACRNGDMRIIERLWGVILSRAYPIDT